MIYVEPKVEIVQLSCEGVIAGSGYSQDDTCDMSCRIYHICRDRDWGEKCYTKQR